MTVQSNTHQRQRRACGARTPRSGKALALLLLVALAAGLLIVLVVASGDSVSGEEPVSLGAARAAAAPDEDPDRGEVRVAVRDTESPATPRAVTPAQTAPPDAPAARAEPELPALNPERWSGVMQRLQRGQDDATRLAAAREILAGEAPGALAVRALDVLAELDPFSVAGELRRLAAGAVDDPRASATVMSAIQTLGRRADVLSAEDLAALFDGGSGQVQVAAAAALSLRGDETLVLRFQEQHSADLASPDAALRAEAVRELALMRSPSTLPLIQPLLQDASEDVRLAALNAVGQSGDPSALEQARLLLEDPSESVRRTAARMVDRMERRKERGGDETPRPGALTPAPGLPGKR